MAGKPRHGCQQGPVNQGRGGKPLMPVRATGQLWMAGSLGSAEEHKSAGSLQKAEGKERNREMRTVAIIRTSCQVSKHRVLLD